MTRGPIFRMSPWPTSAAASMTGLRRYRANRTRFIAAVSPRSSWWKPSCNIPGRWSPPTFEHSALLGREAPHARDLAARAADARDGGGDRLDGDRHVERV